MSSHRGSYRGFDRGRGRGPDVVVLTLVELDHHKIYRRQSINIKTLLTEGDAPTIKGVEYVTSCNWISGKSPAILVPGQSLSLQ
jgi:hypothetical protein